MAADPWAQWEPMGVSPGRRLLAYLLDALLIIVTLVIGWLVWWVICWQTGQSPAKRIMKMRCMSVETNLCAGMGEMAMRELVGKYLLSSVTCGITTIVGGVQILQGQQPLWDKIAKTVLIEDPDDRYAPAI